MTLAPRLLTPGQARRYLAGQDPSDLGVMPTPIRGEIYYDRHAIDATLDARSGLNRSLRADDPQSELETWLGRHGAA